jgi:hypothetical protein
MPFKVSIVYLPPVLLVKRPKCRSQYTIKIKIDNNINIDDPQAQQHDTKVIVPIKPNGAMAMPMKGLYKIYNCLL